MMLADWSLALEPAWPWSIPRLGLFALLGTALLLAGLTLWTYVGVRKATWLRLSTLLLLRLFALVLAFVMMLRPSFDVTRLEGVEPSKLLVIFDASASMNEADAQGKTTRWEQINRLWSSRKVQQRLEQLAAEQKIEVMKYLAAEELRPDEPEASAHGKRTEVGLWLHELYQKHGHEKHLRGLALFSDGGDNGTRFVAVDKARFWRGICPIQTFGVGNPRDTRFGKDIALSRLWVEPTRTLDKTRAPRTRGESVPIPVKSPMLITAIAQAPGFEKAEVEVSVWIEEVVTKKPVKIAEIPKWLIKQVKDHPIAIPALAPEQPGEYKLTVKVTPLPEETNKQNNEISTYVQFVKESIQILWVDRPRVYEPTFALRALRSEKRFRIFHREPPAEASVDPIAFYQLETQPYDVIVIGDLAAKHFSQGKPEFFSKLKKLVEDRRTGLLFLGGTEAFAEGGWDQDQPFMELLPVRLDKTKKFTKDAVQVAAPKDAMPYPFLQLHPDPKENARIWNDEFGPLEGLSSLGEILPNNATLLTGAKGEPVMVAGRTGAQLSRVVVFAGDTTAQAWTMTPKAVTGYLRFWKQLVLWLSQQQDSSNSLWVDLDKRRLNAGTADTLGFTFGLRGKSGLDLSRSAKFTVNVTDPKQQKHPLTSFVREDPHQRGTYQGAKEMGEYLLTIQGSARDQDGTDIQAETSARFLVEVEDVESLRPAADHDFLSKVASAADGRFFLAEEQPLLQYLDELKNQVNGESQQKTSRWPDWKRLPASDQVRDQVSGVWNSFALGSLLCFVMLMGGEWFLRRWWGLI